MSKLRYATAVALSEWLALAAMTLVPTAAFAGDGNWVAELRGPIKRCKVPRRILFVEGDAIIGGKIMFRGRAYYPYGRLEESLETNLSLIRRYGDPAPLVRITGRADGSWSGEWVAAGKGCKGAAKISKR
jgi:hypothetical protein